MFELERSNVDFTPITVQNTVLIMSGGACSAIKFYGTPVEL